MMRKNKGDEHEKFDSPKKEYAGNSPYEYKSPFLSISPPQSPELQVLYNRIKLLKQYLHNAYL